MVLVVEFLCFGLFGSVDYQGPEHAVGVLGRVVRVIPVCPELLEGEIVDKGLPCWYAALSDPWNTLANSPYATSEYDEMDSANLLSHRTSWCRSGTAHASEWWLHS